MFKSTYFLLGSLLGEVFDELLDLKRELTDIISLKWVFLVKTNPEVAKGILTFIINFLKDFIWISTFNESITTDYFILFNAGWFVFG